MSDALLWLLKSGVCRGLMARRMAAHHPPETLTWHPGKVRSGAEPEGHDNNGEWPFEVEQRTLAGGPPDDALAPTADMECGCELTAHRAYLSRAMRCLLDFE